VAALMGAQEFGFATAPLIVMGCKMLRVCSMDTCPFGVATQNEKNRARFPGKPEYGENNMRFVARQLRQIMAELGLKTLDEMCGRSDLLALRTNLPEGRGRLLDLSRLLAGAEGRAEVSEPAFNGTGEELKDTVDAKELLKRFEKDNGNALKNAASLKIKCTDRTLGTLLGSEIQKKYGSSLEDDAFRVDFEGGAGQSFGAFIPKGLTLRLTGDVNDGAGKGLSGGKIVIRAPQAFKETSQENIIAGNAAFFGATFGRGFVNGSAGERFCVRNSGAVVVCEGTGDHALEYMTGGTAVILGPSGKNVAAGMSGGTAYILDEKHDLYKRLNSELVTMYDLDDETTVLKDKTDEEYLKQLIEEHVRETDSVPGKKILADWSRYRNCFKKVIPDDYLRIMNGAE
ncbi:MAG: glutamate synthase subunit alpha, partial [Treponema sp.]|nr:glutamate synthase subunit alpha [Treponema sp.]